MAVIQNAFIGRARGRVGGVVFSTHKGQNIMKQLQTVVANPRSALQQAQRSKFVALMALGRTLIAVLKLGFKEYAGTMSWLNRFMSTNSYSDVLVWNETTSEWDIDYSKVVIAEGSLHPQPVGLNEVDGNDLIVGWNPMPIANQAENDRLVIVAFCRTETVYSIREIERTTGEATLGFTTTLVNGDVIYWASFFISNDGRIVSNSFANSVTVGS